MKIPQIDKYGTKRWFNENGQLHREDGPAIETQNGNKFWYQNGLRHRKDGPSIEYPNGSRRWFVNGNELIEAQFNKILLKNKLNIL